MRVEWTRRTGTKIEGVVVAIVNDQSQVLVVIEQDDGYLVAAPLSDGVRCVSVHPPEPEPQQQEAHIQ